MEKLIRVSLTKPTQGCHDRGVRDLARQLRDAGFEVVNTAVQEDVDVVGVSTSSGGHMAVFEDLLQVLRHAGAKNILVIGGGIIPNADARDLEQWGVRRVSGSGSSAESVMTFIQGNALTT